MCIQLCGTRFPRYRLLRSGPGARAGSRRDRRQVVAEMGRNLVSGFLSLLGARVSNFAIMFVATPIIVRVLGPSGYGNYVFALSVFSLLMVFVSSGVSEGVQKYVGEDERGPDWEEHVVGFYLRLALILAIVGSVFLVVAIRTGFLEWVLGRDFSTVFYLLAALVLTTQFMEYAVRALRGFELERYSESLRVLNGLLFPAAGIALAVLGFGVAGMIVGHLVASAVVALVGLVLIARRVDLTTALVPKRMKVPTRELLSFNVMNVLLVLLVMSLYHADVLMIRVFIGSEPTAFYKAALAVAEFMWFVPTALQSLFIHSTSKLWSRGDTGAIDALASRTTRYALLFSVLLAVGIASLGDEFIPLYYGQNYTDAILPLLILLPGAAGYAVARPIYGIAQGKGSLKPMVVATGGAAALNVALNAALIPMYGIEGAAVATSIGYLSMLAFHIWSANRLGFHPLSDLRLPKLLATAVLGGGPILLLGLAIQNAIIAMVIVPPLGGIWFVAVAIGFGALDMDELREIVDSMPRSIRSAAETVRNHIPSRMMPT